MFSSAALLAALVGSTAVSAGTTLWDGRANQYADSSFLDQWSWSNEIGPYQWYIHGSSATSYYVNLGTSYKNPADTGSKQGIQITNDKTSVWNGQTMLRTELIPQSSAAINKGKVYYHFSMQHTGTNPPSPLEEHQINFFESHFTEMKYGLLSGAQGTSDNNLRWCVGGVSKWNVEFAAGVWHNVAYGIDFSANTVEFYHSTGADDLTLTAGPFSASVSSNGADWHLGVLRLGLQDGVREDWHFSGVYIESGSLTTSVISPGGAAAGSSPPASSSSSAAPSSTVAPPSSTFTTVTKPTTSVSSSSSAAPTTTKVSTSAAPTSTKASTTSAAPPAGSCVVEYVYV